MLHKMKLLEKPFNEIICGKKEIEFRLYDEKRKQINVGDTIEFAKLPNIDEKITVKVLDLYQYPTFKALLKHLNYNDEELNNKLDLIYKIYTKEEELKNGVLGIKIKKQ